MVCQIYKENFEIFTKIISFILTGLRNYYIKRNNGGKIEEVEGTEE